MTRFFILLVFEAIVLFINPAFAEVNGRQESMIDPPVVPRPDQPSQSLRSVPMIQTLPSTTSDYITITFDEQPVNTLITDQYEAQGVVFEHSFIELDNLPDTIFLSGDNESFPSPYGNGVHATPINAKFKEPAQFVEADPVYLDPGVELIIDVYDKNETLIGHAQGTNRVRVEAKGIRKAVFSFLRPNTGTRIDDIAGIDNLSFKPEKPVVVLDPGHGLLLDSDGKTLHYQRPASPTFGLHEDDLTLLIANAAKQQLEANNYKVILTRTGPNAPLTEAGVKGCSDSGFLPYEHCNDDLLERIRVAKESNKKSNSGAVFVSIHTNGSNKAFFDIEIGRYVNGTESFHCSKEVDSSSLATRLRDGIVDLGTWSLFVKNGCSKGVLVHMPEENIPNSLIEVAYHSNTFKLPGPTDEERLNDPAFRADAGKAIATAIEQHIEEMLAGGQ